MDNIPVVDISAFVNNDNLEARKAAAGQLAASVRRHGCAGIAGHGLSEEALQDAFAIMRNLFDLPISEKMKAPHPDNFRPHRGYLAKEIENSGKFGVFFSKSETERAFLKTTSDWKETYDIGHEENSDQQNIWLPDETFPGFKEDMLNFFKRLNAISLAVLEGLMAGMDLNEEDCNTLREIHNPVEHQMRLAHYLPLSSLDQENPTRIRLAPHKDFSSYTLLFQHSQPGLEFQNRETGEYMLAKPKEGVLYLNIGEIFERYSNGFYPAAMHRVSFPVNKNADGTIPGRYSIPYFTQINQQAAVYPMPSRVKADGKCNYEHSTYQAMGEKINSVLS